MTAGTYSTAKAFCRGTHRVVPPTATWERIAPFLAEAGITRLADVTALDHVGVPVMQAVRPASRNLSVSQGKGVTPMAARVSAAMEALELWHAECLDHLPTVWLSLREMEYSNPVPHATLRWAPGVGYLAGAPREWVRARSLLPLQHGDGWLPRSMLELDFTFPLRFSPSPFNLTSNGLASGNCQEEALLHALCELLERDAVSQARRDPELQHTLDPATLSDPDLCELLARIHHAKLKVALSDVTGSGPLPVVVADIAGPDLPVVFRGSGCHPAPEVAVSRALTEALQSRLTYISGARDDLHLDASSPVLRAEPDFSPPLPDRTFQDLPSRASGEVREDLTNLLAALSAKGFRVFYVDLSKPILGLPVVFAFIPGLLDGHHD